MFALEETLATAGFTLRPLDMDHFLMDFDCGRDSELTQWLMNHGLQWQDEDLCKVWVLSPTQNEAAVLGYFTLSAHQVIHGNVDRRHRAVEPANRQWVNNVPSAPAQLLGKFALDVARQGTGLAGLLMTCVYAKHVEAAEAVGAKYLVVEARGPELVRYYETKYGFTASRRPENLVQLYRSTAAIRADLVALEQARGDASQSA